MIAKKRMKVFSNFAFKGIVGAVTVIYLALFGLSFWNIHQYNQKLVDYDKVVSDHVLKTVEKKKVAKELGKITKTLNLSKTIKSNKKISYKILAQIASSVPKRVRFESINYNGGSRVVLKGQAFSDQDILNLIENLGKQKLIKQASLASMSLPTSSKTGSIQLKGFRIVCTIGKKKKKS